MGDHTHLPKEITKQNQGTGGQGPGLGAGIQLESDIGPYLLKGSGRLPGGGGTELGLGSQEQSLSVAKEGGWESWGSLPPLTDHF